MKRALIGILAVTWLLNATPAHAQKKDLQGFSVVLVLGETQGPMPTEGLSAGARKALADLKDFLPYKGYRVLDTQWIAAGPEVGLNVSPSTGHLRGLDNQEYEFGLWSAMNVPHARSFRLRTVALADEATRKMETARIPALEQRVFELRQKADDKNPIVAAALADLARTRQLAVSPQTLIETAMNIDVGETVVVGTSRVQGDKALIVLLTAVPK